MLRSSKTSSFNIIPEKSQIVNSGFWKKDIKFSVKDMPLVMEGGELKGLEDVSIGELQRMAHRQGVAKKDYAASLGRDRIADSITDAMEDNDVKFSLKAGQFSPIVIDANVIKIRQNWQGSDKSRN